MSQAQYIIDRILEDARQSEHAMLEEASRQAEALLAAARGELEARRAELAAATEQEVRERFRRAEVMRGLERRRELLAAKQALLDQAFTGARDLLLNMPEGDYADYLCASILANARGGEELILCPRDRERLPGLLDRLNAALTQAGKQPLVLGPGEEIGGGYLLRSAGVTVNQSLSAILRQAREALQGEAATRLFD